VNRQKTDTDAKVETLHAKSLLAGDIVYRLITGHNRVGEGAETGVGSETEVSAENTFEVLVQEKRLRAVVQDEARAHANEHCIFVPRFARQDLAAPVEGLLRTMAVKFKSSQGQQPPQLEFS
jgi:hypothetical protein